MNPKEKLEEVLRKHIGHEAAAPITDAIFGLLSPTIPGYAPDGTVVQLPNPDLSPQPQPSQTEPLPDPSATQSSPGNSGEGE